MTSRIVGTTSKCLVLLLLLHIPYALGQNGVEILTNEKVVNLVRAGLSETIIVTKIKSSKNNFDLSSDELIRLKAAKVPDSVVRAMFEVSSSPAPNPNKIVPPGNGVNSPATDPGKSAGTNAYPLPSDKGAYLWDGQSLHLLYQSTVPSIGDNVLRRLTPFVKKKFELQLIGARAKAQFANARPTILVSGLQEVIPGIPSYRWLYVKSGGMRKDRRIVGTYDVGGFFGSVRMVDNEIECEIKKVAEGVYAITPLKPLADGEYGLVQVPKVAELSSRPSFAPPIWDFGIYTSGI